MKSQKKPAFTLVELMVAMAIIAVLIGLAAFGISTLQRLSRDNQRRQMLINIQTYVEGFYNDNLFYPENGDLEFSGTQQDKVFQIDGYSQVGPELAGATLPVDDDSSLNGSQYCFIGPANLNDGYALGVQLESGDFFNVGTSATDCDENNVLIP